MDEATKSLPRLIAIFGSGETSPSMTSTHQGLLSRVDGHGSAILLDTPFGFQPNADEITAKIVAYFRERVGCEITIGSLRHGGHPGEADFERFVSRLGAARYVFAGPGSPSYALRHWRQDAIGDRLREKARSGGCVAFASAAAIGLGAYALPVYEIYKVGDDPSWIRGLDVLAEIAVRAAVIPHYNNREGGTHDTRYCYMGEARLRQLEALLPENVVILGVDEHTACIIDIEAGSVAVRGKGVVTIRRHGEERVFQTPFPLSELQETPSRTEWSIAQPVEAAAYVRSS